VRARTARGCSSSACASRRPSDDRTTRASA
jgi:hypothetical protein